MKYPAQQNILPLLLSAIAMALAGCGAGAPAGSLPLPAAPGVLLHGRVHGGQQPVAGAAIFLYAAGLSGNGASAVNLLAAHPVVSDATGSFSITGDYACPTATTPVYLVAMGGNPGLPAGTSNPALELIAVLGDCGNLSPSTFISVNEATTAAAAWALSQFTAANATIGASATNLAGLRSAFGLAASLVDLATGKAPGASLPPGSTVEAAKVHSLANSLAACVNSDGGAPCLALFTAAAPSGTPSGTAPANTFDAALAIVRNPAANVSAIFSLAAANAPFQPALPVAPSDWTMSITYGACATGCGGLNDPAALALDSAGNIWVANYLGTAVSEFSPQGVPAAPQGFAGVGLKQSYGLAVDPYDNVWVANEQSTSAAHNSHLGSISKFTAQGVELSGNGYLGGGVYYPQALAADSTGVLWVADYGSSSATLLANDGSALSPAGGDAASSLPFTSAVALDAAHNAWFAFEGGVGRVSPANGVSLFACCTQPAGIAIDQAANVWVADYGSFSIVELNAAGQFVSRISTANALLAPQAIAVDGAGNVWAANYFGDSITQIAGASAALLSPAGGFGLDAPLSEPYGLAIDAAGNLWLSNSGSNTLTEIVGLAAPVKTPLLGPPAQP